jgi:uncharacterized membrane protein
MTFIGGLFFLAPIVILAVIIGKALVIAGRLVKPLADRIPIDSVLGLRTDWILAILLILFFCFLAGCLARTAAAKKVVTWIETTLLSNVPGYEYFKMLTGTALERGQAEHWEVVLARNDDSVRLGLLIERLDNGMVAVFLPDSPNPRSGELHLMTPDRVTPVSTAPAGALKCLKRLGLGTNELLRDAGQPQGPTHKMT